MFSLEHKLFDNKGLIWSLWFGLTCKSLFDIEVRQFKHTDLKGGTVINGFPSVGLVSTIAASFLIASLEMDQIAALDSEFFPPLSVVYAKKPKFPARIYAGEQLKLAVFTSEFTPEAFLDRSLGRLVFKWTKDQGCDLIITSVGLPVEGLDEKPQGLEVLGVGSTNKTRRMLQEAGVTQLDMGIIAGIPGTLLNEGRWANFDVIALLVRAYKMIPDTRAAARVVDVVGRLLPQCKVDVEPLIAEGKKIVDRIREARSQVKPIETPPTRDMYR
jgi:uncharacterized protein